MDVLDWLSFVIIGSEDLDLESMVGAFAEIENYSTWDQLRPDPCFFLNGSEYGEARGWTGKRKRHLEFSQCGTFDRLSRFDLATEPIVPVGRPQASVI